MQAVAELKLPVNVLGVLALVENMPSGKAMKLGDVLTAAQRQDHRGAQHRRRGPADPRRRPELRRRVRPTACVDLATLTGACLVALGTDVAGLMTNDDAWGDAVLAACKPSGERAWKLPMDDDYDELIKSKVADIKNVGGKWGGAITAAKFLQRFVGECPGSTSISPAPRGPTTTLHPRRGRDRLLRADLASSHEASGNDGLRSAASLSHLTGLHEAQRNRHSRRRLLISSISRMSTTSSM